MPPAIYAALLTRFPRDQYVVLQEISSADETRRADAIAIAVWESRGMEMHGFEVKTSRSDWLRELREPAKAESMWRYCDRWWILATKDVVVEAELPPGWGLLVLRPNGLRAVVQAARLTPIPRPWKLVVRILRHCQREVEDVERRGRTEAREAAEKQVRSEVQAAHEAELRKVIAENSKAARTLAEAEKTLGASLAEWRLPQLREAHALVTSGGVGRLRDEIRRVRDGAARLLAGEGEE